MGLEVSPEDLLPRSRFRRLTRLPWVPSILKRPSLVSRMTHRQT